MIAGEKICKKYGEKQVIDDLSFEIPDRAKVLLFGESGTGKTTLLRLIAGIEKPDSGRLSGYDTRDVSIMFQEHRLLPWERLLTNVIAPCGRRKEREARELLELFELGGDLDKYPDSLSGGMKQRASLVRALLYDKSILLLDEPFSSLDERMRGICGETVKRMTADKTVILVTHRIEDAELVLGDCITLPIVGAGERGSDAEN